MQLLPATRKRVNVFSLPPGGRWFLRSKKRKENAALAQNTRHKTSAFLSYTRAPPYAALRRFPSSRRRAFSQGLSALTFCLLLPHRHSLFSTTRLSRGFRFTKRRLHFAAFYFCYSPIKIASIKNAIDNTIKKSWKRIVFLNHCAKLTSASPKPTRSVPQVGYKTLVYPSANK